MDQEPLVVLPDPHDQRLRRWHMNDRILDQDRFFIPIVP
jgi:hypothetical protein